MTGSGPPDGDLPRARARERDEAVAEARRNFPTMPLNRLLGISVREPDDSGVVVADMPVRPEAFNMSGNLHGGALATLIDVAGGSCAARASAFDPSTQSLVTADLHVRYLGRPKGDTVRAEARALRAGRMLIVVEIRVLDPLDNVIAYADFSSMVVPRREPLQGARRSDPAAPDM
jgi:uncharacterized protein (TIGR00369 family)